MSSQQDICVTPLAGPYTLLPRTHVYAMCLALVLPLPRGWLFRAALAGFTTKTAIFAVDAIVHLAHIRKHISSSSSSSSPLPLELVVVLEMLGLACAVAAWLLLVSRTASASAARSLVKAWCVGVAIAAIIAFVALKETALAGARPFLLADAEAGDGAHACPGHAVLMPAQAIFGTTDVKIPTLGLVGNRIGEILRIVGIPTLFFAALTLGCITAKGPAADLQNQSKVLDLGFGPSSHSNNNSPDIVQPKPSFLSGERLVSLFRKLLTAAVPALVVVMIHRTETYLLRMQPVAPESEPIKSVGQWGSWAATAVVLFATLINAARGSMGYDSPDDALAEKRRLDDAVR